MIEAYFDEGNDAKIFLMGGWLSGVAEWKQFSEEWATELKAAPSIEYFKNNEAMGLKGLKLVVYTVSQIDRLRTP